MTGTNEWTNALGLSCAEKNFLAWLDKRYDVAQLYGSAFVGLKRVFDDFAFGNLYQADCYLPRLYDIAEKSGIVAHTDRVCDKAFAAQIVRRAPVETLCLVRVKHKSKFGQETRYVRAENAQVPHRYGGELRLYTVKDSAAKPMDYTTSAFLAQDFTVSNFPNDLRRAATAVDVVRVTRKRMEKFYAAHKAVAQILHEENELLDKLFADITQLQSRRRSKEVTAQMHADLRARVDTIAAVEKRAADALRKSLEKAD